MKKLTDSIYDLPAMVWDPFSHTLGWRRRQSWIAVGVAAVGVAGSVMSNKAGKQQAPGQAPPIDAQSEQTKAIQGNQDALSAAEKLSSDTNSFNQTQALQLMNQAMPGYSALTGKLTSLADNLASNPYAVPADVQANLQRQAAERGIVTGRQGQSGQFSLLRDLGVNELQYGQAQIGEAQGLTGLLASIAPKVNPMSPISMMISPAEQLQVASGNRDAQQAAMNAATAANNANATANAGMWGNITGSIIGGISGAGGGFGGMFGGGGASPGAAGAGAGSAMAGNMNGMGSASNFGSTMGAGAAGAI